MRRNSTKAIFGTAFLVLFLTIAALAGLQWPVLWVPGAVLMWYGLIASPPTGKIALPNRMRTGLN